VNVSSGSKLATISAMMASMMFYNENRSISPYYVKPETYDNISSEQKEKFPGLISEGVLEIQKLPSYEIHLPEKEHIEFLRFIKEKGGIAFKSELVNNFFPLNSSQKLSKDENSKRYMQLERRYIQKLTDEPWNLIRTKGKGKSSQIELTQNGENMLKFL